MIKAKDKSILLVIDFDCAVQPVVNYACHVATSMRAKLFLLHVVDTELSAGEGARSIRRNATVRSVRNASTPIPHSGDSSTTRAIH